MGARGRKSTAELATKPVLLGERRPEPPSTLTGSAADIWRDTVATLPADWITKGQFPIVTAYCRHAAQAEDLAQQVAAFDGDWLKEDGGLDRLNKLLAMAERETRAMTACARAMRITKQSQIEPRGAGRRVGAARTARPWDFHESDPLDRFFPLDE